MFENISVVCINIIVINIIELKKNKKKTFSRVSSLTYNFSFVKVWIKYKTSVRNAAVYNGYFLETNINQGIFCFVFVT